MTPRRSAPVSEGSHRTLMGTPRVGMWGFSQEPPGREDFSKPDYVYVIPLLPQYMGPGLPGALGAPAQAPAMVDPVSLRRHEAAHALHLSPPSSLLGSPAQEQPMSNGAALACHPVQVCEDEAADVGLIQQAS